MKINVKAGPAKKMHKIPGLRKILITSAGVLVLLCGAGAPAWATELSALKYGAQTFQNLSTYVMTGAYAHTLEADVSDEMAQCLQPDGLYYAESGGTISITAWNTVMTGAEIMSAGGYIHGSIKNKCDHRISGAIKITTTWTNGASGSGTFNVDVPGSTACGVEVNQNVSLTTSTAGISSVVQLTSGGNGCSVTVSPATADTTGGTLASTDGQGKTIHYHLTAGTWDATRKQWLLPEAQDSAVELLPPFSTGEYAGTATVTLVSE